MVICFRHRFLFIKTRKTAGSSIEIALSKLCSEGDFVTQLSDEEERVRREQGGFGPARHHKAVSEYNLRELWKRARHGRRATRFRNHAGLATARALVDEATWARLTKITSERNPWDKAVSRYYWQKRRWEKRPRRSAFPGFTDYLQYLEAERSHWLSDWDLYTVDDEVAVDQFIFFENLAGGLEGLSHVLGLDQPIALPEYRAKSRGKKPGRDYRDEYDARAREIVDRVCRKEIERFGYDFDAPGRLPREASRLPKGAVDNLGHEAQ